MIANSYRLNSTANFPAYIAFALLLFLCVPVSEANAQQNKTKSDLPVWQSYKGVTIGMAAADVRQKLGSPKSETANDLSYIYAETETVEIMLDGEKKVRSVMVMFSEEHQNPPKFEDVFGKGVTAEPKPDGTVYKLVRFPSAGYWVSYSRLAGDKAMVIVMIQKL